MHDNKKVKHREKEREGGGEREREGREGGRDREREREEETFHIHPPCLPLIAASPSLPPLHRNLLPPIRDFLPSSIITTTLLGLQVINATGPFADTVRKMADPEVNEIIVPAKGSHLIMPDHFSPDHMGCVWFTQDGRVLYLLPWEGSTIAGTTDIKESLSKVIITSLHIARPGAASPFLVRA